MDLKTLRKSIKNIISDLTHHGKYPKENDSVDYKKELKLVQGANPLEIFLVNFAKDIVSFANGDGGVIFIGIKENKTTGLHDDIGLSQGQLDILSKLDLNDISQQFEKITKIGVSIDLQQFQISTRKYYYLAIPKSNNTLVPINDFPNYKIVKGNIYYRAREKLNKQTARLLNSIVFCRLKRMRRVKNLWKSGRSYFQRWWI
ncbi:hypothetical protein GKODMF_05120 [Candidatus Electrothrix gigas]